MEVLLAVMVTKPDDVGDDTQPDIPLTKPITVILLFYIHTNTAYKLSLSLISSLLTYQINASFASHNHRHERRKRRSSRLATVLPKHGFRPPPSTFPILRGCVGDRGVDGGADNAHLDRRGGGRRVGR